MTALIDSLGVLASSALNGWRPILDVSKLHTGAWPKEVTLATLWARRSADNRTVGFEERDARVPQK